jgi:apolipoprotein D and lipocalin family protein
MSGLVASAARGMRQLSQCVAVICLSGALASAAPPPLQALPVLEVAGYMGLWYQVAWYPNRFQSQCLSDTRASYRLLADGRIEVTNRCTLVDDRSDQALGVARPVRPHRWHAAATGAA